ncbi:MAG: hypothetical protein NVV82_11300 [Sporocytophaga sp.]|jgi:hypothetical protein|nr:hypothetical protein [Sporocytophaga sp.]
MDDRFNELREKIVYGVNLAVKRMIEKKSLEDGELVYSKNGKIIKVKARDLKNNPDLLNEIE